MFRSSTTLEPQCEVSVHKKVFVGGFLFFFYKLSESARELIHLELSVCELFKKTRRLNVCELSVPNPLLGEIAGERGDCGGSAMVWGLNEDGWIHQKDWMMNRRLWERLSFM